MTELEELEKYVEWNQLTKHQLIVAHMTLIKFVDEFDIFRIHKELTNAAHRTVEWWESEAKQQFDGAPECIFALREFSKYPRG